MSEVNLSLIMITKHLGWEGRMGINQRLVDFIVRKIQGYSVCWSHGLHWF